MSTHRRLACALAALCITAVPAAAALASKGGSGNSNNNGGTAYSTKPPKHAKTAQVSVAPLGNRLPLHQGMHGRDVRVLQRLISQLGIPVTVDGQFGHATWAALRRIEKRAGRPVNGILDQGDLNAIQQVIAQGDFAGMSSAPAPTQPAELPAGSRAKVASSGLAAAPADAPQAVKDIIAAGNRIASKPYRYGGGHGHWNDTAYDCSGSVSYALHGAGLLKVTKDSTEFEHWGQAGPGQWVTIYANGGHAWMIVAGLRFDTSGLSSAGSRWQSDKRSSSGYIVRHPVGL